MLRESFTYRPPFPFGETFIDRRSGHDYDNVYKFNGKELDAETGLYYYGARYYQPQISRWLSVDPLAEKYPGWSPYNYTANNPVMLLDQDGRDMWKPVYGLKNVWKAELGDNAETLARDANISLEEAQKVISRHPYITEGTYVNIGKIELDKTVVVIDLDGDNHYDSGVDESGNIIKVVHRESSLKKITTKTAKKVLKKGISRFISQYLEEAHGIVLPKGLGFMLFTQTTNKGEDGLILRERLGLSPYANSNQVDSVIIDHYVRTGYPPPVFLNHKIYYLDTIKKSN